MSATLEAPPELRKRYQVGVYLKGPVHFIVLGGFCFPRFTGEYDDGGHQNARVGDILELSVEDLRRIDAAIDDRVVRWFYNETGERTEARIFQRSNHLLYQPSSGDESLRPYLYFREAPPDIATPQGAAEGLKLLEEELARARVSEDEARLDPRDARTRAEHARAKRSIQALETPPPPPASAK